MGRAVLYFERASDGARVLTKVPMDLQPSQYCIASGGAMSFAEIPVDLSNVSLSRSWWSGTFSEARRGHSRCRRSPIL
jgi:hypothetical protein